MRVSFYDLQHERFYCDMLEQSSRNDAYHRALYYTLGIAKETRCHVNDLFDMEQGCIKPAGLYSAWQTGSTIRISRLAFNLWNGWTQEGQDRHSAPNELFACSYAPYFMEAIRLRYPEYFRDRVHSPLQIALTKSNERKSGRMR